MLGQFTRVCSLAYDTYNKCIEWFHEWFHDFACVRLFLEEMRKRTFSEKNEGDEDFFYYKKGGEDFFRANFSQNLA